ncbi:MAG: hypothetical protein V3V95_04160 [Thermodesulfobacteriota bacterium]
MFIVAAIIIAGQLCGSRFVLWWITLILLILFAVIIGHGFTGLWCGLLIDERNKISLSRLQMFLWTIVILSGYFAAAQSNLLADMPEPLSVAIPEELWILMGISVTSLIGSPLVKSTKKAKSANPDELKKTKSLLVTQGLTDDKTDSIGQIMVNVSPTDARWSDMFKGEETGNGAHLDLAKVQMFYFTLILVITYALQVGNELADSAKQIIEFPALDSSMLALLGISHAGYLTNKGIPHSK